MEDNEVIELVRSAPYSKFAIAKLGDGKKLLANLSKQNANIRWKYFNKIIYSNGCVGWDDLSSWYRGLRRDDISRVRRNGVYVRRVRVWCGEDVEIQIRRRFNVCRACEKPLKRRPHDDLCEYCNEYSHFFARQTMRGVAEYRELSYDHVMMLEAAWLAKQCPRLLAGKKPTRKTMQKYYHTVEGYTP